MSRIGPYSLGGTAEGTVVYGFADELGNVFAKGEAPALGAANGDGEGAGRAPVAGGVSGGTVGGIQPAPPVPGGAGDRAPADPV